MLWYFLLSTIKLTANLYLKYNTFIQKLIIGILKIEKANEILNEYIKINNNIINKTSEIYGNFKKKIIL